LGDAVSVADVVSIPDNGRAFDRTPPQDIVAEQSVLGGMLLSKDAIADVVEVLKPSDFYRPAHQTIYDAIIDLYGRGEPADPVTIAAELTRDGLLAKVGGAPYLHTLIASVPTAANAGYYAEIVRERAILRRLVEAGTHIVQLGYSASGTMGGDVDDVVDRAQQAVYDVTERRTSEDYVRLDEIMQQAFDEIEAMGSRGSDLYGVPTGFQELDELTNGLHPGQFIVVAGRPGLGKSTFGLDSLRAASIKHGKTGALFSLEMSRSEITMRLLSAEARVLLSHLRTGQMTDDDWNRLARKMGEIAEAPLFIDDSPNLSMIEIRAKARRLKQRHALEIVVVDYLQLMTSPKRVENRQQEVSEISRSLKLLAKELEIPVIAISQLNRGPEQRSDKRPQLSDLRECLAGDTLVRRADTGEAVPIRELVGHSDVPVWTLDEHLRLRTGIMTDVWSTGRKPVFRLKLASGRCMTATANHPLLTVHGWQRVDELNAGVALATARRVPAPTQPTQWPRHEIVMLGHLVGDGCVSRAPVYYCSRDEENLLAVEKAAAEFGVSTRRSPGRGVTYVHFPMVGQAGRGRTNPLYDWLRRVDLMGTVAHSKRLPRAVQGFGVSDTVLFLRHLWATDGSVTTSSSGAVRIYYGTTSRGLAEDVQAMLLRLGIGARVHATTRPKSDRHRQGWTVDVSGREDQLTFLTAVGVHGERGARCSEALEVLMTRKANPNVDVIPAAVWQMVRPAMRAQGITTRELARRLGMSYCGSALYKSGLSRERAGRLADAVTDERLRDLADSAVRWDHIVSIEPAGEIEVFDAHVPGTHSFLANDVVSHNSGAIEQDADMVILLHREDFYERESPRAGEADLIVAKHRNGPTKDVVVLSQLHYSRFVDMQHT
jgi:replicative DNA helicase